MYSNSGSTDTTVGGYQAQNGQYQAYPADNSYFPAYYDQYSMGNQYGYGYNSSNGYFYYPGQTYQPNSPPVYTTTSAYHTMSNQVQPQKQPDASYPSKQNDLTPEKPIMNDSGVELISPTLQTSSGSLYSTPNSMSTYSNTQIANQKVGNTKDEEDSDEEDDDSECGENSEDAESNKENEKKENLPNKPPKPYLEIIAIAILSNPVKMMQLHEIYSYMEAKYDYFAQNVSKSWRNSVRHNLSLNDCFVKAARGTNGKGNYWRIHPLCEREFIRGNFRRKTFKQLIQAGSQQQQNRQQTMVNCHGFNSTQVEYRGINGSSLSAMYPPPLPPTIGKITDSNKNNSSRYRPY